MKHSHSILLLLALAAPLGCQETGAVMTGMDAGPAEDTGGSDATRADRPRPPDPESFQYTPEGCGYMVATPEVEQASLHTDMVGSPASGPDHIHTSWSGPTHTTFAVNWRTDPGTMLSQVLYGADMAAVMAADGPGAGVTLQGGHTISYASIADDTATRVHEVHVCGLTPSTQYFYKVGGAGHWSDVFDVTTGPMPGAAAPFRFAVTGDSRNEPAIFAAVQERISAQAVDFQLFSGDAVVLGFNQHEWDAFFEASSGGFEVQDLFGRTPFMVANGNHDSLAVNYLAQFAVPQDVTMFERAQGEEWYSFDYGNTHFVFLNDTSAAELVTGAQATWLDADLGAVNRTTHPWIVVVHHKPMYSCSTNHGSDIPLRQAWQAIYDRHRVDIVFNGHDHDYERSRPIRGFEPDGTTGVVAASAAGGIPVAESGTMYVVAAGAGAPLYGVDPSCFHTHITESVINWVVVEIEGRTMRYTAYRMDGSVLDEFVYAK